MSHPLHCVLLKVDKAFQDEIITPGGLKLYLDGSYNKNFTVTVTARIAALPIKAQTTKEQQTLDLLSIGDEVCISYLTIFDLNYASEGEAFMATSEGSDFIRTWVNGRGDKLEVVALPALRKLNPTWVGVLKNVRNELIDGTQGSQSDVERWLSQFQLGKTDNYTFSNLIVIDGQEYWKCDLSMIYAKKQGGNIISVGEKIICKPVEEKIPKYIKAQLSKITDDTKIRYQDRAKVIDAGVNQKFRKGEVIAFDPRFLEKYDCFGKELYIISEHLVHGKYVS